jgi:hypothetical protein
VCRHIFSAGTGLIAALTPLRHGQRSGIATRDPQLFRRLAEMIEELDHAVKKLRRLTFDLILPLGTA